MKMPEYVLNLIREGKKRMLPVERRDLAAKLRAIADELEAAL